MVSLTRSSARALAREQGLVSDKPAAPTSVDFEISHNHGTSVAMEATTERLQSSKRGPVPDLAERIEQLQRENGRLRLEVAYHQNMQRPNENLLEDVKFLISGLEKTIIKFDRAQKVVETDWQQLMEGVQKS
jgi:hypothetical protein